MANYTISLAREELPVGTTTIEWTVTDNAGNTNKCSYDVVVNANSTGIDQLLNQEYLYTQIQQMGN